MKKFAFADVDGYVVFTSGFEDGEAVVAPDGMTAHEITAELPAPPSDWHRLHWPSQQWLDTRSLDALKEDRRQAINQAWDAANVGSFTFAGKQIACDKSSRSDIDGVNAEVALTGAMPSAFPGAWKALDNTWVPVSDVATWTLLIQAMVAQGHANFARAQARKAEIDAATTPEALEAIVW